MNNPRILIIGGGPTGCGAAWRLRQLEYDNWHLYEKGSKLGGLAGSFTTKKGFTWDFGGHVLFSRYLDFSRFIRETLPLNGCYEHTRAAWCRYKGGWVPYPFQDNLHQLPEDDAVECIHGFCHAWHRRPHALDLSFREFLEEDYGSAITRMFLGPYNEKLWTVPLDTMASSWAARSLKRPGLRRLIRSLVTKRTADDWGPNATFLYPQVGGIGELWRIFGAIMPGRITLKEEVVEINVTDKTVITSNQRTHGYDVLISTMPLDRLVQLTFPRAGCFTDAPNALQHNSVRLYGVGLDRPLTDTKHWMYFADESVPFYRVTNLSNYSPANVPEGDNGGYGSLLCEIAYNPMTASPKRPRGEAVIDGLIRVGLLADGDRKHICEIVVNDIEKAYPIPLRNSEQQVRRLLEWCAEHDVLSCGRFGAWRYDIGSMDDCFMQGVKAVDQALGDQSEKVRWA